MMKKNMKLNKLIALAVLMGGVTCSSSVWATPPTSPANTVFIYGLTDSEFNGTYPTGVSASNLGGVGVGIISGNWGTFVDKIVTWDGSTAGAVVVAAGGVYGIKAEGANSVMVTSISGGIEVGSSSGNVYAIYLNSSNDSNISGLGSIMVKATGGAQAHGIYAEAGNTGVSTITFKEDTNSITIDKAGDFSKFGIYLKGGTNYIGIDVNGATGGELASITVGGTGGGSAYGIMAGGGENTVVFAGKDSFITATSSSNAYGIGFCSVAKTGGLILATGTTAIKDIGSVTATSTGSGTAYGIYAKNGNESAGSDKFSVSFIDAGGTISAYSTSYLSYGIKFDEGSTGISEVLNVNTITAGVAATGGSISSNAACGIEAKAGVNRVTFTGVDSSITAKSSSNFAYGVYLQGNNNISGLGSVIAESYASTHSAYGLAIRPGTNTVTFTGAGSSITAKGSGSAYGIEFVLAGSNTISNLGSITATSTGNGTAYGIYTKNANADDKKFTVEFVDNTVATDGVIKAFSATGENFGMMFDVNGDFPTGKSEVLNVKTIVAGVDPSDNTGNTISSGAAYGIYAKAGVNRVEFSEGSSIEAKGGSSVYGIYLSGGTNYIGKDNKGLGSITVGECTSAGNRNLYGIYVEGGENEINFAGTGSSITVNVRDGNSYGISFDSSSTFAAGTTKITGLGSIVSDPATDGKIAYGIYVNNSNGTGDLEPVTFIAEFVNNTVATDGVIKAYSATGANYGIMFGNDSIGKSTVANVKKIEVGFKGMDVTDGESHGIYFGNGVNRVEFTSGSSIMVKSKGNNKDAYGINAVDGVNTVTFAGSDSSITAKSSNSAYGIYLEGGTNYIGTDSNNTTGVELGSITAEVTGTGDDKTAYGINVYAGENTIKFSGASSSITAICSGDSAGIFLANGTTTITGLGSITVVSTEGDTYGIYTAEGTNEISFKGNGGQAIKSTVGVNGEAYSICVIADAYSDETATNNTIVNFENTVLSGKIYQGVAGHGGTENSSLTLNFNNGGVWTPKTDDVTGTVTVNVNNGGKVRFGETATLTTPLNNNGGTVEVAAKDVSVTTIIGSTGADKYTFTLPVGIKNGDTMLNITGTTALAFDANDIITVNVGNVVSDLKIADKITLINATTAMTGYGNITDTNKIIKNGGDNWTEGKIGISTDNKQLTFTVIGIKYVDVVPGAVTGNIVTVASAKEATITNGSSTSTVKFNDGDGTATSQDGPWHNIYGGWSDTAGEAVNGNTVNINAGANISKNVYGGYSVNGTADGNSVLITNGTFNATEKTKIYGGYGYSSANNNSVTITNGIFNSATTEIYGGDPSFNSSESNSNNVAVSGGTFNGATNIYGGYIYGVALTKTNSNNVTISGGTFSGITNIYGGYEQGAMGAEADNNIVTINGGTFNGTTTIYGGYGVTGTSSGNTLVVGMKNLTVAKVADFQKYTFTLPVGIKNGDIMLNITGTTALTIADGDVLSVNNVATLADGDTITLITEATGTFNLTGLTFYLDGVELTEEVGEYFKLANNDKSITFTKAVLDVDIKPINKTSGNIVTVTGDRTATVEGETIKTPKEGRNWKNVYGGYAENGDTNNNRVTIMAGTIKGDVYGGYSKTGNATGNIVTWESGTICGELYGGYSGVTGKDVGNNWLKIVHKGETKTIKALNNFSSYVFDINAAKNNDTVLKITEKEITLLGGEYTVVVLDKQNEALKYEGSVCLIDDVKGIVDMGVTRNTTEESDGIVDTYGHYAVEDDGKKLIYTKTSEVNKDGSKAPVEGVAAAASTINTSSDLVLGAGISNLITSTAEVNNTETFAASSYNKSKLKTGSHADVSGYGVVVGVGRKVISKNGNKTTGGLFFEYGNNNYDTFNNGYNGDGKSIHKGAGYIMRWDNKSGNYYEGMVHAGKVTNNWNNGAGYHYDMSPTYFGAAATYGHKFMLGENKQLSIYGSYIYNHIGDGDAVIGNYKYNFEATKSQRTKVGVRYALSDLMDTKKFRPYVGLAWEHEFDGESNASFSAIKGSFNGRPESPSMKGDTGILEIGCKQEVGKWTLGIGAEVFTGKRRGWNGTLQAVYNF